MPVQFIKTVQNAFMQAQYMRELMSEAKQQILPKHIELQRKL